MIYVFMISYLGFMLGYPFLQLWTLLRCRGWWRAFAVFCLIFAVPLYVWSVLDYLAVFGRSGLGSLIVAFLGIWPMLYLLLLALGFESTRKRRGASSTSQGDVIPQ